MNTNFENRFAFAEKTWYLKTYGFHWANGPPCKCASAYISLL